MHKEKTQTIDQHVAMIGRDLDTIVTKCSNYRINLASQQNKVVCDGGTSIAGRLEINGGRGPHRGRDFRSHIRYLLGTRNRDLVDAPVVLSFTSQRLVNLSGVNAKALLRSRRRRRSCGRFCQREGALQCGRELGGIACPAICMYITLGLSPSRWLC